MGLWLHCTGVSGSNSLGTISFGFADRDPDVLIGLTKICRVDLALRSSTAPLGSWKTEVSNHLAGIRFAGIGAPTLFDGAAVKSPVRTTAEGTGK